MQRFLSLDPLAADFADMSPYNYVMGNPIMLVDPTGLAPERTDYEYEVKTNEDGTTTTTYTGEKGGDDTDYITYVDKDGNVTGTEEMKVLVEYESGPGINPVKDPLIGYRLHHGKNPTDVMAYSVLIAEVYSAVVAVEATVSLGFAKLAPRVPKGQAMYDLIKNKVVKGGQFLRKKMNGYMRVLKKGEKVDGVPDATHISTPFEKDNTMDEFVEKAKRYLGGHDDG